MDPTLGIVGVLLVVVGGIALAVDADRRTLIEKNERLADALDDAANALARVNTDPLTGSTFTTRRPQRVGWKPRPTRRIEALRELAATVGEEPEVDDRG